MASSSRQKSMENWERLVRAALKRDREGGGASIGRATKIERILHAADDIEDDDLKVALILSEQAYRMALNLDPSIAGTGALQFKIAFACVCKQKLYKVHWGPIHRQNEAEVLRNFYLQYKMSRPVDDTQREQEGMREPGTSSAKMGTRAWQMKKIYATLRSLLDVLEHLEKVRMGSRRTSRALLHALEILVEEAPTHRLGRQILDEVRVATAAIQNCEHRDELSSQQLIDEKKFLRDYFTRNQGGCVPEIVADNWERLVQAVLKQDHLACVPSSSAHTGIGVPMLPSARRITYIEQILQAVDDITDRNASRIVCEQAYVMARDLDPSSKGRGVLQFKTGLASVIKYKYAKKAAGGPIDRQNDIEALWNFYLEYKRHHPVDDMHAEKAGENEGIRNL